MFELAENFENDKIEKEKNGARKEKTDVSIRKERGEIGDDGDADERYKNGAYG